MGFELPVPLPWNERTNSVYPIPGGKTGTLISLRRICEHVLDTSVSKEDLIEWVCDELSVGTNHSQASVDFLNRAGLVASDKRPVAVPEAVRSWLRTREDYIPIAVMHGRIRFIGEMLSEIPGCQSSADLLRRSRVYGHTWDGAAQISSRLAWLVSANLVDDSSGHLELTSQGEILLEQLDIHNPDGTVTRAASRPLPHRNRRQTDSEELGDVPQELLVACTDTANPTRFEQAVCRAFAALGFVAEHLGGSGRTDVLLTAPLGKEDAFLVAVDAKTRKSGPLPDANVDWLALKEHRNKHRAEYSLLVAPDPSGDRLKRRAREFGVTLLSARQLADICARHATARLSLVEYTKLFASPGDAELAELDEAAQQVADLRSLAATICRELLEGTKNHGRMTAREVELILREQATGLPDGTVESLLDTLSHPLIGAVYRFSPRGQDKARYVLAASLDSCEQRIRALINHTDQG